MSNTAQSNTISNIKLNNVSAPLGCKGTPSAPTVIQQVQTSMEETKSPALNFSSEIQAIVRTNVDVLITICVMFGFEREGYSPQNTYNHYFTILSFYDGNVMKMFKDKLASFRAYHNAQTLPASPCPPNIFGAQFLFGGRAHRFLRYLQRKDTDSFDELVVSLCQAKKGMTRPTKRQVNQAMIDTFKTLTAPRVEAAEGFEVFNDWGLMTDLEEKKIETFISKETCTTQLKRTVNEIFSGKVYTDFDRYKPYFPSSSADYNNTRSAYGIVGQIIDEIHKSSDGLFSMLKTKDPLVIDVDPLATKSSRHIPILDETPLLEQYKKLYDVVMLAAESESPDTKLVGLAEALKVRVISKGPAFHYFVLKPLQKFLWSTMKDSKMFRFIGRMVTEDDVQDVIGIPEEFDVTNINGEKIKVSTKFLSLDYSDATNQIRSWASEVVIEELCKVLNLDSLERKLFLESMTQHIMYPPAFKEKDLNGLDLEGMGDAAKFQNNGQLMGSIVSFPILCLINATICRWVQEIAYGKKLTLEKSKATVNGDDGLLITNIRGKEAWEKIAPYFGLKPSLGKVFFSQYFFDINSTNFTYNPEGYEGVLDEQQKLITYPIYEKVQQTFSPVSIYNVSKNGNIHWTSVAPPVKENHLYRLEGPKRIVDRFVKMRYYRATKFVNSGLLFGVPRSMVKVSKADDSSKEKSFGSVCRELIQRSPEATRERVMKKFINVNDKFLKEATKLGIPWYVPEEYGGLGMPIFGQFRPSELDLRLMRKFWRNRHIFTLPARPKFSWRVWDYVSDRLKELGVSSYGTLFTEEFSVSSKEDHSVSQLEGLLAIESIFVKGESILPPNAKPRSYMPQLGKFNKKLLKDQSIALPEPFSLNEKFPVIKPPRPNSCILIASEKILSFPQVRTRERLHSKGQLIQAYKI